MVMVSKCPICGGVVSEMRGPVEWEVRGEPVAIESAHHGMCQSCGEVYFPDGESDRLHAHAVNAWKKGHGLLTGDEIREIRQSKGLSQSSFEKLIGAGPKTVVRWENATVIQNRTADTLMRVVRDYPDVARDLALRAGVVS